MAIISFYNCPQRFNGQTKGLQIINKVKKQSQTRKQNLHEEASILCTLDT